MTIEFAVCDKVWKSGKDWLDLLVKMCEDFVVPKMFVSGLEVGAVAERTDAVKFGLDVERVGELVSILLDLKG